MERRGRFLKDQADASAANFSQILGRSIEKILSLEEDGALLNFSVGRQKPQESSGKRALA